MSYQDKVQVFCVLCKACQCWASSCLTDFTSASPRLSGVCLGRTHVTSGACLCCSFCESFFHFKASHMCFAMPEKAFSPTWLCLSPLFPLPCPSPTAIHVHFLPWQISSFLLQGPCPGSSLCLGFFSPCFIHRTLAHPSCQLLGQLP